MDLQKEREAFEAHIKSIYPMGEQLAKDCGKTLCELYSSEWQVWQAAKAQAVPEGFVFVEKSKVRTWYQDDDEPENFCNSESDLDCLGDCLDHEDILQVNKIEDAIIQTTPMYGVWKFKIVGGQPERDCFVLCNTEEEAISIREEYRRMIDLEAQEPTND